MGNDWQSEEGMAREIALMAFYKEEIEAVAEVFKTLPNRIAIRQIFVEATIIFGITNLDNAEILPETRATIEAMRTVDPRHLQFVLGAAVLKSKPE